MQLPDPLREGLAAELASTSPRDLSAASQALSQTYRSPHGGTQGAAVAGPLQARAYAAYRMPATIAALAAAFREVRDRLPGWVPRSLLDVGTGPGSAAWAAVEMWPGLERIVFLEREPAMIELGRALATRSPSAALRQAEWRREDITGAWDATRADLAVTGYVLGELAPDTRAGLVRRLWECTDGASVIVEPGTPRGYADVVVAGEVLAALGARIIAPVPLSWPCLEHEHDWLHFSDRVSRSRLHRTAKDASLSFEDEKYSYVAAARLDSRPIAARVVRQPQIRSGHVRLTLCTKEGIRHLVVSRRQKDAYRRTKDLRWGSAIEEDEAHLFDLDATHPSKFAP